MQQKIRGHARRLCGTKSTSASSRKHLPEVVQKTYQRSYYSMLPYEPKEILIDAEGGERPDPFGSEIGDHRTQGIPILPREEEGIKSNPTQLTSHAELYHLEC